MMLYWDDGQILSASQRQLQPLWGLGDRIVKEQKPMLSQFDLSVDRTQYIGAGNYDVLLNGYVATGSWRCNE